MRHIVTYVPMLILIGLCGVLYVFDAPMRILEETITSTGVVAYLAYLVLLVLSVVCMPVTIFFIIPIVASILGPFVTGTLTIVGWTIGAVIAFLISRRYGRPIVAQFVTLETVDRFTAGIPERNRLVVLILLRMVLPVDVLSYALGLSRSITLRQYVVSTVIGITGACYAFAYMGNALFTHNLWVLTTVGAGFLATLIIGWYLLRRNT